MDCHTFFSLSYYFQFATLCKILYNKFIIPNGIVKILTYITLEVIKMEERNEITSILKSNDPEKLVVFRAASLQNEIRFYLNANQYITAVECEEGCVIRLEEEKAEEQKSNFSIIKENLKEFIKLFSIILVISLLSFICIFYLCNTINNILAFLIIMNIIYFIEKTVSVVIIETMKTVPAIKSKHSAEHMMVNFLENNKRLPKNIEEVRKSSRFSPECGSRELISGFAEELIRSIIATIFTVIVSTIVSHFSSNSIVYAISFLSTYYLVKFVVGKIINKYGALNFIIKPIKRVLTNIAQCANTTNKVKDKDIVLAYAVARPWLQIVYPEFYNENEDIFWENI